MASSWESLRTRSWRSAAARLPGLCQVAAAFVLPLRPATAARMLLLLPVLCSFSMGVRPAAALAATRGPRPHHAAVPQFTPTLTGRNAIRDRATPRGARAAVPFSGSRFGNRPGSRVTTVRDYSRGPGATGSRSAPLSYPAGARSATTAETHHRSNAASQAVARSVGLRALPHTPRGRENHAGGRLPPEPPSAKRAVPRSTSGSARHQLRRIWGSVPAARASAPFRSSPSAAAPVLRENAPSRWSTASARNPASLAASHGPAGPGTSPAPSRNTEVFATGESHPEDDERLPLHPAPALVVADSHPLVPVERAPETTRVNGFGAEGAMLGAVPAHGSARQSPPTTQSGHFPAGPQSSGNGISPLDRATPSSPAELTAAAMQPLVLPALYGSDGRLVMPAPLRGTRDILYHQNQMADQAGLERMQDDSDLRRLASTRQLVEFPVSAALRMNPELPLLRRLARPWTTHFTADAAHAFSARFGQPLQVNSAVRTVAYQRRLQRVNGNAAAIEGDGASPHLTGQAVDLAKRGMSQAEIAWMRSYLIPLIASGKVDVEEEFQQACFHISVYRSYEARPASLPRLDLAQVKRMADQARPIGPATRPALDTGVATDLPH